MREIYGIMKSPVKRLFGAAWLVSIIAAASPCLAAASWGNIVNVHPMARYGVIIFDQSGARSNAPSCQASGIPQRWAFRVDSAGGQSMLQTLLSAYVAGKRIWIDGTGNCSAWGDSETVLYFRIED